MHSKYDFSHFDTDDLVYIKTVAVTELPLDLQRQVGPDKTLYAVHKADGERVAVVENRALAYSLARDNDLTPMTLH
ncbi:MAG: DUF1150 family protein [Marinovum sp.]|jgi:hypothetical protein|nr:hypothetical protein [Marinovum sp.]MDB2421976.1 DUF1150 domain-containing protein [Paracoccaceae bacterium]MDC3389522.1 DUF1150 domain-containing protein [bacterium]MBP08491.1 hypothetical protein [Marinovum sp.]MBT4233617.1 DUF1150 family protein [Marinovum sp.]|tara:strand:+ start:370 stop:597 length:228 start_codon:yes stop_codon:yes gene_type:complete